MARGRPKAELPALADDWVKDKLQAYANRARASLSKEEAWQLIEAMEQLGFKPSSQDSTPPKE
jgi:hypothetical protein